MVGTYYNKPPWDFDEVDEVRLYREAELLDVQREIHDRDTKPGVHQVTSDGKQKVTHGSYFPEE